MGEEASYPKETGSP